MRIATIVATAIASTAMLAPVGAQADPAATCTDNKPANGFAFTCDAALAAPAPGRAYPLADGISFQLVPAPLDAFSTVEINSFSIPFQCSKIEATGDPADHLDCGAPVAAGQTVSGTVAWTIGFHPHVPLGNCLTAQVNAFLADPGPENDLEDVNFPIQLCQSSTSLTPAPSTLTAARAKRAANSALLKRFGKSWRNGSSKRLACAPLGTEFDCKVSWRRRTRRYKGHVFVSERNGKVGTRVQVHSRSR